MATSGCCRRSGRRDTARRARLTLRFAADRLYVDNTLIPCKDKHVIQSFADPPTDDVFHGKDSKAARTIEKKVWSVVRRKLDMVNAAAKLEDLRVPAGNRLEALKGDRKGRHSIRVNDRLRITFRFQDGNAHDVCCEDYH